jgi:hypothetical protein
MRYCYVSHWFYLPLLLLHFICLFLFSFLLLFFVFHSWHLLLRNNRNFRAIDCYRYAHSSGPGPLFFIFLLFFSHCLHFQPEYGSRRFLRNLSRLSIMASHSSRPYCLKWDVYSSRFWRVLTMVHNTQNYWVFGLCPSSGILETRKHNISETGYVSVPIWGEETPGTVIEVRCF